MSLNKFMHPRNLYKNNPPDFKELKEKFPNFSKHVKTNSKGHSHINFKNKFAVIELVKALAKNDFGLQLDIPNDRLVPTLPSRINYLLFVEDLLRTLPMSKKNKVLDIGCGSVCIYALLGCKINKSWEFVATEKDSKSYKLAVKNVEDNFLCERISVKNVNDEKNCKLVYGEKNVSYSACMCNPPFFSDQEEQSKTLKRPVANSTCSGSAVEMLCEGGDFAFAAQIYKESLEEPLKCSWFTTMLGKKSSYDKLLKMLLENKDLTIVPYELCQGNTMRWVLAWSYEKNLDKSYLKVSEFQKNKLKRKNTKPLKFIVLSKDYDAKVKSLLDILKSMLKVTNLIHGKITTSFNLSSSIKSWVGCRKRQRLNKQHKNVETNSTEVENSNSLVLDCSVKINQFSEKNQIEIVFHCDSCYRESVNELIVYLKRRI